MGHHVEGPGGDDHERHAVDLDPYVDLCPAERTDVVVQLTGLVAAAQAELVRVVVAADEAHDWQADGATDMAAWLSGHCAMAATTARQIVKAARALVELPALHAALASGEMSWEQVRPATRFATPATDAHLASTLPGHSVEQIEALAREHRPRRDADANDAHRRRRFGWRPDHEGGGVRYSGFLPTDQATTLNAALTALADKAGPAPETGLWDPFATRCADALHALADDAATDDTETSPTREAGGCPGGPDIGAEPTSDRARRGVGCHVTLHVDEEVLSGRVPGNGTLDGLTVGVSTVRRLLCDAQRSTTVEDAFGRAVGIGRNAHDPPRWLRRQVLHRDGTCRFPGCSRPIRHLHHIAWWTRDLGPTDAPNLAGLCWAHHRLVHEGGWSIEGNADLRLTFVSPTGKRLESARAPTRRSTLSGAQERFGLPTDSPTDSRGGADPP